MEKLKDKKDYFTDGINYTDYFYYKDVKEAVLEFKKWINGDNITLKPEGLELINEELNKIFGDFEK